MYTHTCVKSGCGTNYESEEADAYLCPSCITVKQQVAAELDQKFNTRGQQPNDMFAGSKELKMTNGRVGNFFRA